MKRIITIQDISCLGKCSLTVALPIISAYGIEACVIPTAVLSTHTMFSNFTFDDLTDQMIPIKEHWEKEKFEFDAIYTGYLGSEKQIEIVKEYIQSFKKDGTLVFIDPVMADNGKLYTGFDIEFAHKMAKLCGQADIIVPNLTEACFMLDEEYIPSGYSEEYIKNILLKLSKMGPKISILTGVSFNEGQIGVMGYNRETKEFFTYYNRRIDAAYHGTGDIFSSCAMSGIVKGYDIVKAMKIAADYTARCIEVTKNDKNAITYGVNFESVIPELIEAIK